jgi:Xaa-Pro aminopeptidase
MESTEVKQKLERIHTLLSNKGLDALLLRKVSSVAWATGGAASYINSAVAEGTAGLLITPKGRYLITNNIEAPHYDKEEGLLAQGWELHQDFWYKDDATASLVAGLKLGVDGFFPGALDLSNEIARLRANLLPVEEDRFRELGKRCAAAMQAAIRGVRPGQTEYEIAALLGAETQRREVQPIVNLIATDERIFNFRHPLPTSKKMERYAMLVLCGRWQGLVCSLTRLVHFGKLPVSTRQKADAVARIDATFFAATRPGQTLGQVFNRAVTAYAETGFAGEWQLHHQGGPAGYEPREYLGLPGSTDVVVLGQAYAWNPSITGVKSEDTILVGERTAEVITAMPDWPSVTVTIDQQTFQRPAILEVL